MKTVDTHGTFEEAIARANPEIQDLARTLRDLIAGVYPEAVEVPWPKQQITGYGLGPKKMSEHFSYIAVHSNHANLGFYYGAGLPDPHGLLEGSGKNLRHVKIGAQQPIPHDELRQLLELAIQERESALGRARR